MLLLGVVQAQKGEVAPPAPTGSFDLLETTVLTSAESSVEFINLGTKYAADYQHLQIRAVVQSSSLRARMNEVTSAGSYKDHRLFGFGGSVGSDSDGTSAMYVATTNEAADTNQFTPFVIDILDPFETTKNKTIRTFAGRPRAVNAIVELHSGLFISTDAVSSINLFAPSSISIGSRFSLYGVRTS